MAYKRRGVRGSNVIQDGHIPFWFDVSAVRPNRNTRIFGNATAFSSPGQSAELASIYVQLAAADGSFAIGNIYGSGGGQGQP
jgi:hypothetical protein